MWCVCDVCVCVRLWCAVCGGWGRVCVLRRHPVHALQKIHATLKRTGHQGFLWLAGDSSLDNKVATATDHAP